jgi:hypothetical protein
MDPVFRLLIYPAIAAGIEIFGVRPTTKGAVSTWLDRFRDFLESRKLLK